MAKTRRSRGSRKASRKASRKGSRKHRGGASRKASSWAQAVKRVHQELKRKDANASLGDAMKEASKRKKAGTL